MKMKRETKTKWLTWVAVILLWSIMIVLWIIYPDAEVCLHQLSKTGVLEINPRSMVINYTPDDGEIDTELKWIEILINDGYIVIVEDGIFNSK